MSDILLVGVTHASAPMRVLERVALTDQQGEALVRELRADPEISEAMVVSTCNRVEVYAAAPDAARAQATVARSLAAVTGVPASDLAPHTFARHGDEAAHHLFEVTAGLDSLITGDAQILGQVRSAYAASVQVGASGPHLHRLAQHALRAGKRVTSETGLSGIGASIVDASVQAATAVLPRRTLAGTRTVVLGAGALGALMVSRLQALDVQEIVVVNRTPSRAVRLAAESGSPAVRAVPVDQLAAALADTDVLFSCASSAAAIDAHLIAGAARSRPSSRGPLVICDLGMPRNVDPIVAAVEDVVLLDLESMSHDAGLAATKEDLRAARELVRTHLAEYVASVRAADRAPAVAALRANADQAVGIELERLRRRLPDLDEAAFEEVAHAMRRASAKILHPALSAA